ncbi:MAG: nuclear transport factor 2 family protein [Paracoccaceae bacterium]|nr:nuclear transport factor 2 family protein [Paracoccaceae bacterium]MDG1372088.1 nuclear transport factor 2 family protein [Paracoccaceae bacterium]
MSFADLIAAMTTAAADGRGAGVAACFTPDGVYHDVFYGDFQGPEAITDLIENHFHRDAEAFRWDVHNPANTGDVGYARYTFSYRSKLAGCAGRRGAFEGVAICQLKNGLIADYSEIANAATGLRMIGFEADGVAKFIDGEAAHLMARDEMAAHRG